MKRNRKKFKRKSNVKLYLIIVFSLSLFIGLGYSYLQTALGINGLTKVSKNSWDVHFENLKAPNNNTTLDGTTSVKSTITLNPGDVYYYTVDVVNNGTIDAKVGSISPITIESAYRNILEVDANYVNPANGEVLSQNDVLRAGTKERIKFKVRYKSEDELAGNVTGTTLTLKLTINYVQADENVTEVNHTSPALCVKASKLHTEECSRSSGGCYSSGYYVGGSKNTTTITYGTNTGSLTTGYALDCDVNFNGEIDVDENGNSTERFYYVGDKDGSTSDYATLIYYKNINNGEYNSNDNSFGPSNNLLSKLPDNNWDNPKLIKNMTRQIYNELGLATTTGGDLPNFNYKDKSARLITYNEIKTATSGSDVTATDALSNYNFLLENTDYSKETCTDNCNYWTETPLSSSNKAVWIVDGTASNLITIDGGTTTIGVRPVIEVLKTNISID